MDAASSEPWGGAGLWQTDVMSSGEPTVRNQRPNQLIPFQGKHMLVWPEDAAIDLFHTEPTIGAITFSDADRYLSTLTALLEEAAADRTRTQPIAGGAFVVEDILQWEDDALDLVDARAWKFVSSMLGKRVRTEQAHAIMIPRQRELPLRPHALGKASVVMLVQGSGLYLRHHALNVGPVAPPQRFGQGGMLAHPSTMRPCVAENTSDAPIWLLAWDYMPVTTA